MPTPDEQILNEKQIAEIEARASAASEGPWRWRRDYEMPDGSKHWELSNPEGDQQRKTIDASLVLLLDRDDWLHRPAASMPNWEFIAHARADIPALCATVKRLREDAKAKKIELLRLSGRGELLTKVHVEFDQLNEVVAVRNEFDRLRNISIRDLQSQLEQLRAENEKLKKVVDAAVEWRRVGYERKDEFQYRIGPMLDAIDTYDVGARRPCEEL